ncbi:MAG: phosphatidate cytidylyltransferase [Octadecabacter sp.]|nr:phosphatidate cytidylyltransferase [Octadecabacter sp.]
MAVDWDDLKSRLLSGAWLALIGIGSIIVGGVWFQMLAVFVTALMVWECWTMIRGASTTTGILIAVAATTILSAQVFGGAGYYEFLGLFFLIPIAGAVLLERERMTFFIFALGLQIAGNALVHFRVDLGLTLMIWLVSIVVVTDVVGYFVGKAFGGPKFWPTISPKKTWSGTVGGWIGAAIVGIIFVMFFNAGWTIILLSIVVSFAGQMGDIAESALKRRQGVKDSSTLIPGHGGLFDRFDALLGASLFMLLFISLFNVSGATF